jgi:hypothetical protein
MTLVHIYFATYSDTHCVVIDCPTCQRMRRALAQFQEWYGWTTTCCGCGDQWTDGEPHPREFRPGWRQENIRHARKVLESIGAQA